MRLHYLMPVQICLVKWSLVTASVFWKLMKYYLLLMIWLKEKEKWLLWLPWCMLLPQCKSVFVLEVWIGIAAFLLSAHWKIFDLVFSAFPHSGSRLSVLAVDRMIILVVWTQMLLMVNFSEHATPALNFFSNHVLSAEFLLFDNFSCIVFCGEHVWIKTSLNSFWDVSALRLFELAWYIVLLYWRRHFFNPNASVLVSKVY